MTLQEGKVGEKYIVTKVTGSGPYRRRIMDMGITKNTEIYVRKFAPLGDPIQINLRNYELTLRKEDAKLIEIQSAV